MSETPAAGSRGNAASATGPKTAAGKARSSKNALRHGFSAAADGESEDRETITRLARAFLGEAPQTGRLWSLAREAARAQRALDLIRGCRLRLITEAEGNPAVYRGPPRKSDRGIIMETLKNVDPSLNGFGSEPLRELLFRLRRQAPREPLRRHAELFVRIAAEVEKLDRYELRAISRRRRAIFALDALKAGVSEAAY